MTGGGNKWGGGGASPSKHRAHAESSGSVVAPAAAVVSRPLRLGRRRQAELDEK